MDLSTRVAGIGSLAEPVRRALYDYVAVRPDPVGREEAADALGIPLHTAKFHLDRLVEQGLLDMEFKRLSGRTGPGAGRPAKLYRRSDREFSVSLPPRRYDLVGDILASAIESAATGGTTIDAAVDSAATAKGQALGSLIEHTAGDDLDLLAGALTDQGYEARVEESSVVLANCPFHDLAADHTELVCAMNRSYVQGVANGLGLIRLQAHLEPEDGLCCVKTRRH